MIGKIKSGWRVFKAGEIVANPTAWKKGQIGSNALAALLIALFQLLEAFGVEVPISGEGVDALAGGLLVVGNLVCTVVSTNKVGLQPRRKSHNEQ